MLHGPERSERERGPPQPGPPPAHPAPPAREPLANGLDVGAQHRADLAGDSGDVVRAGQGSGPGGREQQVGTGELVAAIAILAAGRWR
ncbi:hypothetical protein [Streptomyces rimosus]|uniref:hypothetical protein n=1 Tax=Streptomyces rimosus TaxID=1927 RepID=UPI0013316377|nr:hypothetical protein [Streptomyces rimosus]